MALIKCRECGKEISTQAASCPQCGAVRFVPKVKAKTSGCAWIVLIALAAPFVIAALLTANVPTTPSKEIPTAPVPQPTPARTFTENDVYWDKGTTPHKAMLLKAINRIHREDSRCQREIDPGSVSKSADKSKPGKPVFFVTCGKDAGTVNVFFSADQVESATALKAPGHISRSKAIQLCEAYAKTNASDPSTVSFSRIMDASVTDHPNGRTQVNSSFEAKNAFNLELKFNIRCLLDENGIIEGQITESTG